MKVRNLLFLFICSFHEIVFAKMGHLFPEPELDGSSGEGGLVGLLIVIPFALLILLTWARLSDLLEKIHPILGFPFVSMFIFVVILIAFLRVTGLG
jgi:hypothetical protein